MKKTRFCALLLGLALLCSCGSGKKAPKRSTEYSEELASVRQLAQPNEGDTIAIFTTNMGEVRAVLYPDAAPMAVYNFVGLARSGYYDGTQIWYTRYGSYVQGGDAGNTGEGAATIWSNNAFPLETNNDLRHYAGALCAAFATGGDQEGGTGQFYIVTALPDSVNSDLQTQLSEAGYSETEVSAYAAAGGLPYLDNTDTVFGQVYSGMEIADKMACVETVTDEDKNDTFRPTEENTITVQHVTIATYPGPTADELAAQWEAAESE